MNEAFANEIEDIVWMKDVSYTEAVIVWCEQHSYELESIALLIKKDPVLKTKIMIEAQNVNMLKHKKGNILPV